MAIQREIDSYLRHLTIERGLSRNTLAAYGRDLSRYEQFLEEIGVDSPQAITKQNIADFGEQLVSKFGLSASSVARVLSGVRGLHRFWLVEAIVENDDSQRLFHWQTLKNCFTLRGQKRLKMKV